MLNHNDEIWKDVVGFEGRYRISSFGRVLSLQDNHGNPVERIRGTCFCRKGYELVQLAKEGAVYTKLIHRLVAEAFLPNPGNRTTVNHIDGVKDHNYVTNLEWATYSENHKHAYQLGLKTPARAALAKKTSSESKYNYVTYDASRNRWAVTVKILGTRKSLQKNFSCAKYGTVEAEKLAAKQANVFLDSLGDTERPRNVIV